VIDTQGLPPYHISPNRLSFWEEAKVNRHIQALIKLGKMRANSLEYAYEVTLPIKKYGSKHMWDVNLKFNPNKCMFSPKNIKFLGHVAGKVRIWPNPDKVKVVEKFPIPKIITNVWAFLGLTQYYWNYVKGYAKLATFYLSWQNGMQLSSGAHNVKRRLINSSRHSFPPQCW
jgi:hypothetical protein